ncbi:MAG: universal stress protein [Blastocatellia bacterium]
MKIILATDGSPGSHAAVAEIARRPWPPDSIVRVISVVDVRLPGAPLDSLLPDSHYLELVGRVDRAARDAVDTAVETLVQSNAHRREPLWIESAMLSGYAAAEILREAKDWRADLIVIGSHGYGGWQRFWLGSVSQAVLGRADCSVEVVRTAA